ncbi:MAG: aminotransferase class V-fold PLP-dependent enzyme [Candidatus Mycalebacterium zealandia]|nr:MAG: aminotransferase class V-fold PLP-dependent enzyme [Candidatus Mycalebacterium zealandia]
MENGYIYLDNNASSRALPEVVEKTVEVLKLAGNPSSPHSCGRNIRKTIEDARRSFAAFVGAETESVVFTSSGTEANNMALIARAKKPAGGKTRIVTTPVEHSSVKKMCASLEIGGAEIARTRVDSGGLVDIRELEKLIKDGAEMVSVQWVNNETGVIQDIESISALCEENGVLFHTDAAQAAGKMAVDVSALGVDFATFTGHKFNAPLGCGAIFAKDMLKLNQMLFGGFQESGFRPGTENMAGIAGIGAAAEIRSRSLAADIKRLAEMRDFFENEILSAIADTTVNGDTERRVCNTSNIMFGGVDGAQLTAVLDSTGVKCSQSSACTTSDPSPSYVLTEMGFSQERANSSIRFSFGVDNSMDETRRAVEIVIQACGKCA